MFSVTTSPRLVLRTAALRRAHLSSTGLSSTRFYSSTMHENDPQVLEREKFRNLSKAQKKHSPHEDAPGWNERLASASEAAVKADRSPDSGEEMVINTLQFMRDLDETETNGDNTAASYSRDEVSGPLKGVGKEEVTTERSDTITLNGKGVNRVVKKETKKTRGAKVKVNREET